MSSSRSTRLQISIFVRGMLGWFGLGVHPFGLLAAGCLGASLFAAPIPTESDVVELPTFTIQESRLLPEPESWRFAQISGFEVLSNASDGKATRLIKDFQRFHQALIAAWPPADLRSAMPSSLILCGKRGAFDAFRRANEQGPDVGLISLSLRDGEVSTIVIDLESTTLSLVAGGAARTGGQPVVTAAERKACMRRLTAVTDGMDLVVIDCGSRFDAVAAAFTPHADERLLAITSGSDPVSLAATYALCKAVHTRVGALPQDLLVNRLDGRDATRCFDAVDAATRQFLGTTLRFAGAVPSDPTLDAALRAGMPFPDAAAGSPAAIAAHDVVMRTLAGASLSRPGV